MDDPNITMEEYIRLEEKAQRHGRTFNWQTATFGKVKNYEDEDDHPIDFETEFSAIDLENEFPAIVYNDGLTSKSDLGIKPLINSECIGELNLINETSLSEYDEEIVSRFNDIFNDIHLDNLKSEKDDDDNDIGIIQSSEDNEITHGENGFSETSHDKIIKTFETGSFVINLNIVIWNYYHYEGQDMAPLPAADQRHAWLRYQIEEYTDEIRRRSGSEVEDGIFWQGTTCICESCLEAVVWDPRAFSSRVYSGLRGVRRRMTWRQFILALGLHTEQEMAEAGFGAYWPGSDRLNPDKGDFRDYWMEISSDKDFLGSPLLMGQAPEKVTGVDLFYLRSMDRGPANVPHLLAQYLFRHAEGRKSGARLSGGHFIGRLAMHFGLVSDKGLRGLQVVTRELPLIDLHELGRLHICMRYGDTWAWVSQGPKRQQAAAVGA
ncbi:hypothetical protein Tco_0520472 [Tanacetum coccineum]